jgi:hypothetical protein
VNQELLLANDPILYYVFSLEINERKHDCMQTMLKRRARGINSNRLGKEAKNIRKKGINLRRLKQKRIF